MIEIPADLHPSLTPLAFLLGTSRYATDLLEREVGAQLLSIRRSEDYLFLRYGLPSRG